MKVLLINPPVPNILRESLPSVVEDETGVYPPLGLLYLAAYVEQIDNCSVQVLDCQAQKTDHEALSVLLGQIRPDIVGIQVMTFTVVDAVIVAKTVRGKCPDAFIVLGGPHPSIYPWETVELPEVDAVISGEGEYIFSALVQALLSGEKPETVTGVLTSNMPRKPCDIRYIPDLDQLRMPAWHLINLGEYSSPLARANPVITMMSSRGCPSRCVFCDRPQMGRQFRKRSAPDVVAEMRYCREQYNIGEIKFYDDTFTIDRQRVIDICDLIISEGLNIGWDIRARVDNMTPHMLDKLQEAGCYRIHYGVETGSPRIQKRLRKDLDLQQVGEVFKQTREKGIEVLGYFMIGCPDETAEDVKMTLDLLHNLPMDYAHISIFTPYPGTQIYAEALETGFYKEDYWKAFARKPSKEFSCRYWNQYFTDAELHSALRRAYGKFYGNLPYMFKSLLKIRTFGELMNKASLGFKLLRSVYFG